MNIKYIEKTKVSEIQSINFDILIGTSGYEKRSSFLFNTNNIDAKWKMCFGFKSNKILSRNYNDNVFKDKGFKLIEVDNNSSEEIIFHLNNILTNFDSNSSLNILIDYSSMSTLIYSSILRHFNDDEYFNEINLYFSYTQAVYVKPNAKKTLKFNNPIPIFPNIDLTDKRIALIIGLGYENDKALGLYEYFQNDKSNLYLFMTDSEEYNKVVCENNKEIISIVDENNLIKYDLTSLSYLASTLNSLICFLLDKKYRVVLAPSGPKVFTLMALIISFYNKKVSVYRSSIGDSELPQDKLPDEKKEIIITHVNLFKPRH